MTEPLYLNDHYLKEFDAVVTEIPGNDSVVLNRTAFYPKGGGQPSDHGTIIATNESSLEVIESSKTEGKIIHKLSNSLSDEEIKTLPGHNVHASLDWDLRYKHMRHHTALHILSGVVFYKFNSKITGGQIYPDRARLDFTLDNLGKDKLDLIVAESNRIVLENKNVKTYWITTEEAAPRSELYRLSADLLPKGQQKLRIVEIVGFDAQLDGGTHVAHTGEIGKIGISKTENKGRDNKRIEIILDKPQNA